MSYRHHYLLAAGVAFLVAAVLIPILATRHAAAADAPPVPVLLELYTAEGCSSCPPADIMLSELQKQQPLPGVQIIALGLHVDYWDNLGWRDRFSNHQFTLRQEDYDRGFDHQIFTPEMIVDGKYSFIGGDPRSARADLLKAAETPKPDAIAIAPSPGQVQITVNGIRHGAKVYVAVAENGLETNVGRGENGGKTLHHDAVVRGLYEVGTIKAPSWTTTWKTPKDDCQDARNSMLVVFVQKHDVGDVLAIKTLPMTALCAPAQSAQLK